MHDLILEKILQDCADYEAGPDCRPLRGGWTREQLIFALNAMALRLRLLRQALHAEIKRNPVPTPESQVKP